MTNIIERLRQRGCVVEPCGSRVTCNPAPTNTDADYLVECRGAAMLSDAVSDLGFCNFEWDSNSKEYQMAGETGFMSWRGVEDNVELNFIITRDHDFAARHRVATAVCKDINIMHKPHRIRVFQAILYQVPLRPVLEKSDAVEKMFLEGGSDMRGFEFMLTPPNVPLAQRRVADDDIPF